MQTSESPSKEWKSDGRQLSFMRRRFERQKARAKRDKCRYALMELLRNSGIYDDSGYKDPNDSLPDELAGTDFFQKS